MKSTPLVLVALAAIAVGGTAPARAAAAKKPKPVTSTYYFHSVDNGGTGNGNVNALAGDSATGILPMDAVKPAGATTEEYGTFGAANNPNHECLGNALTMHPTWTGKATGTLTGKVTVTFYARSTPGNAIVQLFGESVDAAACNANFPTPLAEANVALPVSPTFGLVTATLTLPKPVLVKSGFTVQITTDDVATPQASDIGFDSATAPSGVTWTCLPNKGKKTC
jgi:hypothetical protein